MKRSLIFIFLALTIIGAGFYFRFYITSKSVDAGSGMDVTSSVRFVNSAITADGNVTAQTQAKLSFASPGKLTYLPFKEGDRVKAGQTIAQLDTYALQRQLTATLNNYRSARDTFDQTQQNYQDNILNSQVSPNYSKANSDTTTVVNDAIKRILDQNQSNLDNSVINVELANYALQLSTISSPINGILTHSDAAVAGLNITPAAVFTIADPDSVVFRANVPASSIYYVLPGRQAILTIDGLPNKITGTVSKIYPSKIILPTGQSVYAVDIVSPELVGSARLDQTGKAIINTESENVALVPAWTVLGGRYLWINNQGRPELKQVTVGKIHGNEIEITSGLSAGDRIIINPRYISSQKYPLL